MKLPRQFMGDLWGGVAAVAVILPQAMAFGVALLALAGFSASTGALVGLVGAAAVCLGSGLVGGTRGLISAPTGPMLVIQVAAVTALAGVGLEGDQLLASLAVLLLVVGLFQFLIGLSGGGRLIKFLPYPVVAGFITGSGILMILSQLRPLTEPVQGLEWQAWYWVPVATAAVTFFFMSLVPAVMPRIPGTIGGLVAGTLFFQLITMLVPADIPAAWVIGHLPNPVNMSGGLSFEGFGQLPWHVILPSALALAVLASVDTLLTSVVADVETKSRHVARRELIGQGIGQMMAGVSGGMAGAGSTGATLIAIRSGGRRWVGVSAALVIVILVFIGRPVGEILPISVLAGVILHVAIGMLDRDIVVWLVRRSNYVDAVIAILVTVVTVVYDLMIAVGVGVVIAIILFIRNEVRSKVIHRRSNGSQIHSVKARSEAERQVLDDNAERIVMYELKGNLFFATADKVFEELSRDLERSVYLILHLRRVRQIDLTAIKILHQITERIYASGGQLAFCELHSSLGLGNKMHKTLKKVSAGASPWKVRTFLGSDEAFAWAEDQLLAELGADKTEISETIRLANMDLCADMHSDDIAALESVLERREVDVEQYLFRRGDYGDELFIVQQGQIDVRLKTTEHHYKRLASYGPGTVFGEVAFFDPGQRAADAIAIHHSHLLVLNRDALEALNQSSPGAAMSLLHAIGKRLSINLRWSAREIRRLSQW